MITYNEAIIRTERYVKANFRNLSLRKTNPLPLEFPDGWRFVYESYFGELRLRDGILILFVPKTGYDPIEVDFDGVSDKRASILELKKLLKKSSSPPIEDVLQALGDREFYQDCEVIYWEPVLDWSKKEPKLKPQYWRFVLRRREQYIQLSVGYNAEEAANYLRFVPDSPPRRAIAARFGRMSFDDISNQIGFELAQDRKRYADDFKVEDLDLMRYELYVWYCRLAVVDYLSSLGFGDVGLLGVDVSFKEFIPIVQADLGAITDDVQSPVVDEMAETVYMQTRIILHLPYYSKIRQCWAEDPTVVIHELGHALWHLVYTRPPVKGLSTDPTISSQKRATLKNRLHGIQEGFCDYFAAMIMAERFNAPYEVTSAEKGIGSRISPKILKKRSFSSDLPRFFNGREMSSRAHMSPVYAYGLRWANFLWDLRSQLHHNLRDDLKNKSEAEKQAILLQPDKAILLAHLRPRRVTSYGTALKTIPETSAYIEAMKMNFQRNNLPFSVSEWDKILSRHRFS